MLDKKNYANGQKIYELNGNKLTYFFKDGTLKAEGRFENGLMEGEWKFYRATGKLWQVGNFKNSMKNGTFIRYDKNNQLEYHENFEDNKMVKTK